MKLTVIGGGSTYTPELVDGLGARRDVLPVAELALVDPDQQRLAVVAGLARRILDRHRHPARVSTWDGLESAVDGAAAVLVQLRVGGQAARRTDETIPLRCGCIGQETTGAGGLAKALRTVPVVRDIARRVAALAPDTWIVDFTNPVGIVTRALLDDGHRAVGLCNVAIGAQRYLAGLLGAAPERITLDHVGLNHLTWERAVRLDGVDVLPKLIAEHAEALAAHADLPVSLIRRLGAIPSYYLRYYYLHDQVLAEQADGPTRADQVTAIERELLAQYADPALDRKPALLEQRGGAYYSEAAVALIADLLGTAGTGGTGGTGAASGSVESGSTGGPDSSGGSGSMGGPGSSGGSGSTGGAGGRHVLNVRNRGTLPFLPDDAVIEVPARVHNGRIEPEPVSPVNALQRGLIAHVAAYEELALDAAREGGPDAVATALLAHPLVGQAAPADRLATLLIDANRRFLPWAAVR